MVRLGVVVSTLSLSLACTALAGGGGTPRRNQNPPPAPVAPVESHTQPAVAETQPTVVEPAPAAPVESARPAPTQVDAEHLVTLRGRLKMDGDHMVLEELRARPPFVRAQRHPIKLLGDDVASIHSAIHRTMGLLPEVQVKGDLLGDGGLDRTFQAARFSNLGGDRAFAHSALMGGPRSGKVQQRPLRVGDLRVVHPTPAEEQALVARAGQEASVEGWLLVQSGTPRGVVLSRVDGRPVSEPARGDEPAAPTVLPPGEVPTLQTGDRSQREGGMAGKLEEALDPIKPVDGPVAPAVIPATAPVESTTVAASAPTGEVTSEVTPAPVQGPTLVTDGPSHLEPGAVAPVESTTVAPTPTEPVVVAPTPIEPAPQETAPQQSAPAFPTRVKADKGLYAIARELRAQLSPAQRAQGVTITTPMLMLANGLEPGRAPRQGSELIVPTPAAAAPMIVSDARGRSNHWIQEGDSLWKLARGYGTTVQGLLDLNPELARRVASLGDTKALRAGDLLLLPEGAKLDGATRVQPGKPATSAR